MPCQSEDLAWGGVVLTSTERVPRALLPGGVHRSRPLDRGPALAQANLSGMSGSARAFDEVPGLRALVRRQAGVVSRSQLAALGVTDGHIRSHIAARRWRTVSGTLVVTHLGPLTLEARHWPAVLGAPEDSVLGAHTALTVLGLSGWERDRVHLVVARGAKVAPQPWLVVHESRRLRDADVRRIRGLPFHSVERAAVDAAAWQPSWRTAAGLMAAVVQQRLTTVEKMHAVLDDVGAVAHRKVMRAALADIAGGADSLAEIDLARLCRVAAIPEPTRQAVRLDARGRRRYLDAVWELGGGRRLVVEVDGVGHLERERWYDDLLRDAEIGADPTTVRIRIPAMAARHEPERVVAIIRRHLGQPTGTVRTSPDPRRARF